LKSGQCRPGLKAANRTACRQSRSLLFATSELSLLNAVRASCESLHLEATHQRKGGGKKGDKVKNFKPMPEAIVCSSGLVKAAPELLATVKRFVEDHVHELGGGVCDCPNCKEALALIAKVEGGSDESAN
jgi:hypothetical protein